MENRYIISYCSGATGYGWTRGFDDLKEYKSFLKEMRNEYTAAVDVWDNKKQAFIFYKRTLTGKPDTDLIFN